MNVAIMTGVRRKKGGGDWAPTLSFFGSRKPLQCLPQEVRGHAGTDRSLLATGQASYFQEPISHCSLETWLKIRKRLENTRLVAKENEPQIPEIVEEFKARIRSECIACDSWGQTSGSTCLCRQDIRLGAQRLVLLCQIQAGKRRQGRLYLPGLHHFLAVLDLGRGHFCEGRKEGLFS